MAFSADLELPHRGVVMDAKWDRPSRTLQRKGSEGKEQLREKEGGAN